MLNRILYPALAVVAAGLLAPIATAQTVTNIGSKALKTLTLWTNPDTTTDVATDALGNRYIVGNTGDGTTSDGYLVKVTKTGVLVYNTPIDLGTDDSTRAVVYDSATDQAFVATNAGGHAFVQAYDNTGAMVWSEDGGLNTQVNDLAMQATGDLVTAGTIYNTGTSSFNPAMGIWLGDGSANDGFFQWTTIVGEYVNITQDGNGVIYCAGGWLQTATQHSDGLIAGIKPDFTAAVAFTFGDGRTLTSNNESYTKVVVDPVSNMAAAVGKRYYWSTGVYRPMIGTLYAPQYWATGSATGVGFSGSFNYDAFGHGVGSGIASAADGSIYFLFTGGVTTGPRYVDVYNYKKSPTQNYIGTNTWADEVVAVDPAMDLNAFSIGVLDDNSIAVVSHDSSAFGSGTTAFQSSFVQHLWGADGAQRQMIIMNKKALKAPAVWSDSLLMPSSTFVTYAGSELTVNTPSGATGTAGAYWWGKWYNGGNDTFAGKEDTTFSLVAPKSLSLYDAAGFGSGALTTALNAATPVGLDSVTVNSDGTFTAVPTLNFYGAASFMYDVIQNGNVVKTYSATINLGPLPDDPIAVDDSYNVAKNSLGDVLTVLSNDSDPDNEAIVIKSKSTSLNGTITLALDKMTVTYKPKKNFVGVDTFTYTIKDPTGRVSTATVTVTVGP
ncbi:MAG TPA: Ig-like domain-containing protein [Fimbriimonas sp.]|nr:Ig-like domain-containing protein [Fimbriimonas sp.]